MGLVLLLAAIVSIIVYEVVIKKKLDNGLRGGLDTKERDEILSRCQTCRYWMYHGHFKH